MNPSQLFYNKLSSKRSLTPFLSMIDYKDKQRMLLSNGFLYEDNSGSGVSEIGFSVNLSEKFHFYASVSLNPNLLFGAQYNIYTHSSGQLSAGAMLSLLGQWGVAGNVTYEHDILKHKGLYLSAFVSPQYRYQVRRYYHTLCDSSCTYEERLTQENQVELREQLINYLAGMRLQYLPAPKQGSYELMVWGGVEEPLQSKVISEMHPPANYHQGYTKFMGLRVSMTIPF